MAGFDMDIHARKQYSDRPLHAVIMKKRTLKSEDKVFISVKRVENFLPTVFHGVGFWYTEEVQMDPKLTASQQILDEQEYEEVWIPYEGIEYIKSLTYTKK